MTLVRYPNSMVSRVSSIISPAGALLSQTAKRAMEEGLTGMEFAAGIPGSIGGGIVMNAGAYGPKPSIHNQLPGKIPLRTFERAPRGYMRFVIVTGMSGGGKRTALKMLEDTALPSKARG